jgi:hypothetical protein
LILKFELDGKSWDYDEDSLMVDQGIAVEKHIGGTLMDYDQGLSTGRSDCYQALGWLIFHGGSPDVAIDSVNFPLLKLSRVYMRARMDEIEKAEAALKEAEDAAKEGRADPTSPVSSPPSGPGGSRSGSRRSSSPKA